MHFINRHGLVQPVGGLALVEPLGIAPGIGAGFGDDGGGAGPQFEVLAVGIGFQQDGAAVAVAEFKLVEIAGAEIGDE